MNTEDLPVRISFSLHRIVEELKRRKKGTLNDIVKDNLTKQIEYADQYPELISGFEDFKKLDEYRETIATLLDSLFSVALSHNEIKAASIPFHTQLLNTTSRFDKILADAGPNFEFNIRDFEESSNYILVCMIILNSYYHYNLDFNKPLYADIPGKNGLTRHYRIFINADFVFFEPTEKAVQITPKIMGTLIKNVKDVDLWKKFFPIQSWLMKGVILMTLTDVSMDDAISKLKSTLLFTTNLNANKEYLKFEGIFRSIFNLPDIKVGLTELSNGKDFFINMKKHLAKSYILDGEEGKDCQNLLCPSAYKSLIRDKNYLIIPDVEHYAKETNYDLLSENLLNQGIQSCILAPIAKDNHLLAILEIVSPHKNELNGINALRLDGVLPYLVSTIERKQFLTENRIKAVIQSECTSIHPSVLWVFEREAKRYIEAQDAGQFAAFKDVAFKNVYPLYGQIDIVGSSEERNTAIQKDILIQLKMVSNILKSALEITLMSIYEQINLRITKFKEEIEENLLASSESEVFGLLQEEVNPLFEHLKNLSPEIKNAVENYESTLYLDTGLIYNHRKKYDDMVMLINQKLSTFLDSKQRGAQKIFPHYFERYKTDGVDHNMYIGASITQRKDFDIVYLFNLRLWQLCTMCEMENHFYHEQVEASLQLNAASLILVFSNTLSIRYRMDEKRFDVDGTYNARYEIIKKRIDKAFIKGSTERITQKGKIAIIYSQEKDRVEYDRYIKYLQHKNYLGDEVEYFNMEDVQGVTGLKAIRVDVIYSKGYDQKDATRNLTYNDLIEVLD